MPGAEQSGVVDSPSGNGWRAVGGLHTGRGQGGHWGCRRQEVAALARSKRELGKLVGENRRARMRLENGALIDRFTGYVVDISEEG